MCLKEFKADKQTKSLYISKSCFYVKTCNIIIAIGNIIIAIWAIVT